MKTTIEHEADDKRRGMTFGELRAFVAAGLRANVADDQLVRQSATWRGTIKKLEVQGDLPTGRE